MCVVVHADLGPVGLLDVTTFPDPSENAQNPETVHEIDKVPVEASESARADVQGTAGFIG
jgi:hypothetical protein